LITSHPNTLYLRQKLSKDTWLFFEAKMGPWATKFGKTLVNQWIQIWLHCCDYLRQVILQESDSKLFGPVLCTTY